MVVARCSTLCDSATSTICRAGVHGERRERQLWLNALSPSERELVLPRRPIDLQYRRLEQSPLSSATFCGRAGSLWYYFRCTHGRVNTAVERASCARTSARRSTSAHIFRPVSACPLRSPICVHATVQSVAIKSDSGRRNICKTSPDAAGSLLFARSPPALIRPCRYHAAGRRRGCVIKRTRPRYRWSDEHKRVIRRERYATRTAVSDVTARSRSPGAFNVAARRQPDSIPISGRTGDILPRS